MRGRGRPRRKDKDKYGVPYNIFRTCKRHARAAGSDTVEEAASKIVQCFGCPMLYAEPPKPRFWTEKLRECRRNFGSFMLLIAAAALAIPCVFHRRVVHEARTLGDYAIALKNTNHPDRKQLGVRLAHALPHKVNRAMIEIHEFLRDYVLHDRGFVVRRQVRLSHLVMIDQCVAYLHGLERRQAQALFVGVGVALHIVERRVTRVSSGKVITR